MIESSPFTDNLIRVHLTQERYNNIASKIEETPYSRDRTYGFLIETASPESISAYLVITTPIKVQNFNQSTQKVEDQVVKRTDLVPFRIDYETQFLEIFSNKKDVKLVLNRLSQITDWNFSIEQFTFPLDIFYEKLLGCNFEIIGKSIRINNFSLSKHTKGNCYLKVFEERELKRLLTKYGENATYLGTEFDIREETITVGFYRSGSIRLYSKTDQDEELLYKFKEILRNIKEEGSK